MEIAEYEIPSAINSTKPNDFRGGSDRITTTMAHEYACSCTCGPTSGKEWSRTKQILTESAAQSSPRNKM